MLKKNKIRTQKGMKETFSASKSTSEETEDIQLNIQSISPVPGWKYHLQITNISICLEKYWWGNIPMFHEEMRSLVCSLFHNERLFPGNDLNVFFVLFLCKQ